HSISARTRSIEAGIAFPTAFCYVVPMPITQSAKKAVRSSLRKKAHNDSRSRAMNEIIKKIEKIAKTDKEAGKKMLSQAFAIIDKAAGKNVIKKNNAARKKSRLSRLVK